jgi:hypothetical protein
MMNPIGSANCLQPPWPELYYEHLAADLVSSVVKFLTFSNAQFSPGVRSAGVDAKNG